MPAWLWRHAREFDIAHVHLSRDLVTLPATTLLRRAGVPYVVQTHGMVTPDSHPLAAPIDRLRTAKLLREASCVLELNDEERQSLRRVAGDGLRFRRLRNGVPVGDGSNPRRSRSAVPEVLFLARLHERKRPQLFAEAGLMLLQQGVRARFAVVGPAEGAEAGVDSVLEVARREGFTEEQIRREAGVPPESVADRMAKASVYVLPASHEPFGLTIIEALAQGVPVVTCADGGLASFIRRHRCGLIADVTAASFAAAIGQLLENPAMAADFGDRGRQAVRSEFSLDDVGKDLEDIYSSVLGTQIS